MDEQQVMFRPIHYQIKDNIGLVSSFGDKIVESMMDSKVSSETEFWERVFNAVKEQIDNDKEFFAKPQWEEICNWLSANSFMFNLQNNKSLLENLFSSLRKSSDALYAAFEGEECPPDIPDLCKDYFNAYSKLSNHLQERKILFEDSIYKSQFLNMLRTGYKREEDSHTSDGDSEFFFRFFSPVFLENLCIFYNFLEYDVWYQSKLGNFDKERIDKDPKNLGKENIKRIYKDIIREKFKHLFFLEVTQFNDRYISTYYNISVPKLMNRDHLSSVEPIRPVRWIDKIVAYVKKLELSGKGKTGKTIKIATVGYVNLEGDKDYCFSRELNTFYDTLRLIRTQYFNDAYDFEINIFPNALDEYFKEFKDYPYPYRYDQEGSGISINVEFVDYSTFFGVNTSKTPNICNVIKDYNIVLIEDVPNVYTHEYKLLKKSGKDFPDVGSDFDYESEYRRIDFKNEDFLVMNYRYAPINLLTSKLNLISMNEDVYGDTLKYKLNQPLIDYLKEYITHFENDPKERNVYIFTSKKSGVEFSDYAQYNFIREERYNAKSFYLTTLSNRKRKDLQMCARGRKKTFIVFSLWNMLKNIDYSFVESGGFLENVFRCKREEVCALATKIYIKMNWDYPNKKFIFEICIDPQIKQHCLESDKQQLANLLEDLFKIIFSSEKNLFARCLRHSFLNAVYSQMEYIEDVVFYCVLYNGFSESNKPSIEVRFTDFEERYVYSVNQPIFWNFTNILKLLNENISYGDRVWEIKRLYENNHEIYQSIGLDTSNVLLQCVKEICEEYGYTDSNIYGNLVSLLA